MSVQTTTPTKEEIEALLAIALKGIEEEGEIKWRKDFLRKIGYKL